MEPVNRRSWKWVLVVAVVSVALSSIPYAVGYLRQTPDIFIGAVYDYQDYYSHLAKMQQGVRGEWRYHILFTPEDHEGACINLFYLALGHLSAAMRLSPMLVYHLARPLCALVLLLVAYAFIGYFVDDRKTRAIAYVLVCFSSGLGWLVLLTSRSFTLGGITPVDFWLIEMYTFFTILTFPHTCLAQAAHLLAFLWMVQFLRGEARWRSWLPAVGATLILSIVHPYSLLPLNVSLAAYWLYLASRQRDRIVSRLFWLLGFALLPLPWVAYSYLSISANPVFSAWQAQSYTLSPPPLHYLLGYGMVLGLAAWGAVSVLRKKREGSVALVLWPVIVAPLLYLPLIFNLQRRMIEGVHVPLSTLAAMGLRYGLLPSLRRSPLAGWMAGFGYPRHRFGWLAERGIVALTTISTWYLLASLTMAAAIGNDALYLTSSEVTAVDWLGRHTSSDDVVLSSYAIGGYIPARTGHRVFWGHWAESIYLPEKRAQAHAFYGGSEMLERRTFLARYDIQYVFYGPRERDLGGLDPWAIAYLEPVFSSGEVVVYRVDLGG